MSRKPHVGDTVRIERDETLYPSKGTWPQFRGRVGTVVEINLGEYGVVFGKTRQRPDGSITGHAVTWFQHHEICAPTDGTSQERHGGPSLVSSVQQVDYGDWSVSLSAAECSVCDRVFTRAGGFDRHRRAGKCIPPETVGMVLIEHHHRNGAVKWRGWGRTGTWKGPQP